MELLLIMLILNPFIVLICNKLKLRRDNNCLCCGITAYCGSKPADPNLLRILMLYNIERGEDSTGWAINNQITKDTQNAREFLSKNKLTIKPGDKNFSIIAHSRKASSGAKGKKELAHPFGMTRNGVEKEDYDVILAMNGTLQDPKELGEEFGVIHSFSDDSDTRTLTRIIANLGESKYTHVLEKYVGCATLVFMFPSHPNTLVVYKDPERPLYMWKKSEGSIYVSSMDSSLEAIGALPADVKTFKDNTVNILKEGKLIKIAEVKRTPLVKKPAYHEYPNRGRHVKKEKKSELTIEKITEMKNLHSTAKNRIYCILDKYYRTGHLVEQPLYIDSKGEYLTNETDPKYNSEYTLYYFIYGYMIKDKESYDALMLRCSTNGNFEKKKFIEIYTSELSNFCGYPIIGVVQDVMQWIIPKSLSDKLKFREDVYEFTPFLSRYTYLAKYQGSMSQKNEAKFGIDVEIKEIPSLDTDLDDVKKIPYKECKEIILKEINSCLENQVSAGNIYIQTMLTDTWRKNPSDEIKDYFYKEILIPLLKEEEAITDSAIDEINIAVAASPGYNWEIKGVKESLRAALLKIKKKNSSPRSNDDMSGLSTQEKLTLFNNVQCSMTPQELIDDIKIHNTFFGKEGSNSTLKKDIIEAKDDFEQLLTDYLQTGDTLSKEAYYFYEAILLSLLDIQKISIDQLIVALDTNEKDTIKDLYIEARGLYNLYYKEMQEAVEEDDTEDVNDVQEENETEQDMECYLEDSVELMEQIVSIEVREEEALTDRSKRILSAVKGVINDLKKVMIEKEEQEEETSEYGG